MRLRHIEIFSAIMQTGSTIGAARILNVSQPAVSKMLQHAELSLGFSLFLRAKGKLVPTPEALRLQQELGPFDEQLARIRRVVNNLSSGSEAPLRIAATPAIAHHLAPRAVALWCQAHPKSECFLAASHTRELLYSLLLNEIDIALTMQPISHPNLITSTVRDCEVYAIAPAKWWTNAQLKTPVTPAEMAGQPFISIDVSSHLGASVSAWLADVNPPPDIKVTVQTYTLARSLVEANIGIAVVDNFTATAGNTGNADQQIQIRRVELPALSKIYAVTNRARPAPKSADFLLEAIRTLPV